MTIRPEPSGLAAAREFTRSLVADLQLSEDEQTDMMIAVGEALSNSFQHGTSDPNVHFIFVEWYLSGCLLTVIVRDEGCGCKRPCLATRRIAQYRGWGIFLMRSCVDEVVFRNNGSSEVILRKAIGRQSASVGSAEGRAFSAC